MVYKIENGHTKNPSNNTCWVETVEIDENTFLRLHMDLCQKPGVILKKNT